MRVSANRKLAGLLAVLTIFFYVLIPSSYAAAANYPYFRAFGGDVMAGGWFDNFVNNKKCDDSSLLQYYQDPWYKDNLNDPYAPESPTPPGTGGQPPFTMDKDYYGGIIADVKNDSGNILGAGTEYAAFATGKIGGHRSSSGFATMDNKKRELSFANNDPANAEWGGNFQGAARQTHCIPDYFGRKPSNVTKVPDTVCWWDNNTFPNQTGDYFIDAFNFDPASTDCDFGELAPFGMGGRFGTLKPGDPPIVIPAGKRIVVYVNGQVIINRNIVYASHSLNDIPKFALVVRGVIAIDPKVTQLDGLYIAQVRPEKYKDDYSPVTYPLDGLIIDGCWKMSAQQQNWPIGDSAADDNCSRKLRVNGALVAKQIWFNRSSEDPATSVNNLSSNETVNNTKAMEVINYTPEMVLGGNFFTNPETGPPGGGTNTYKVDSVISLPPVF